MGVQSGHAVAYGGVPVGEYYGSAADGRQLVNPDAQLTQSGFEMPLELDPSFCEQLKDDDTQCRARKVRGERYCVGHLAQHEKQLAHEE